MKWILTHVRLFCILAFLPLMIIGVSAAGPTPISFGSTVNGTIITLGQTDSYTFNATTGDTIYSRMDSSWGVGPRIRLYAPNGTLVATSTYTLTSYATDLTQKLTATGKYTLVVGDNDGSSTGTYGLYLQRTNNAGNAESIAFGETKTGSITKLAQMNNYTFNATTGDTIYSRMDSSWGVGPQIRLYAPDGTLVTTSTYSLTSYATDLTQKLTTTGKYTLLVGDNEGGSTGTYSLSLKRNGTGVLAPVANFTATPRSGTAPLTVTFTDTSTNTPTSWKWSFGDGNTTNSTVKNPIHRYASAGTYTVSLNATNAGGSNTKTQSGYITVDSTAIIFGETVTGTISTLGQTNKYTFDASAGDTIYSRMDSSWATGPQVRLYAPNGTLVATTTGNLGYYATDLTQILTATGKYTLLAGDNIGDATGTYGLSLQRTGIGP